ncbi:MAG: hypothetical protein WCO09_02990 [bacterium]
MTEQEMKERIAEAQRQNPEMFEHPELKTGEIHLGDAVCNIAIAQVEEYKRTGLPSARLGNIFSRKIEELRQEFEYFPIFANLCEIIIADEQYRNKMEGVFPR